MTEYEIIRLGHHGDGIAHGPLFAPMTLPGEIITGTPQGDTLTDIRIQTPSSDRIKPICRHFKACGGCQLQHAKETFVADWKAQIVQHALNAHHLSTKIHPTVTSPAQSRQRATIAGKRTKKGAIVGFHGRASDTVIEVPDCQLVHPKIQEGFAIVQQLTLIGASRKAPLSVTLTLSMDGLDAAVQGGKPLDGPLRAQLAQYCEQSSLVRLTWDDETIAMRTPPCHEMGTAKVVVPAGAFLQATQHGAQVLQQAVLKIVGQSKRVLDLFAGCGTFSLPLAQHCEVHAVEGDKEMTAALDHAWRMSQGLKPVSTQARDLFRRPLLVDELNKFNAIVIDPPRAGAVEQTKEIIKSDVKTIAYVSCNPASFAKDAAALCAAGFALEWVQPVDQFRWSSHVELVASFQR